MKGNKNITKIYDKIEGVGKSEWESVPHDSPHLSYDYLKALECTQPSNLSFIYVLVKEGGKVFMKLYFQVIDLEGESFDNFLNGSKNISFNNSIKRKLQSHLGCIKIRLLVNGNVFISGEHGMAYDKELMGLEKSFVIANDVIENISKASKNTDPFSLVLLKDFYEQEAEPNLLLKKKGYTRFKVDPNMLLNAHPNWENFEDYLNALLSKYRVRAKGILKKSKDVKRIQLGLRELKRLEDRIHELYFGVFNRAKFKPSFYHAGAFYQLKKAQPNEFFVEGYFIGEELVAFRSYFVNEENLEAHFVGFDQELNKQYELYQTMLYNYIQDLIEKKRPLLYFGRSALEIKSNVGAIPSDLYCYIKHLNPVFNLFVKPFISHLQPDSWVLRSPFKKEFLVSETVKSNIL